MLTIKILFTINSLEKKKEKTIHSKHFYNSYQPLNFKSFFQMLKKKT